MSDNFSSFLAGKLKEAGKYIDFRPESVLIPMEGGDDVINVITRAIADKTTNEVSFYHNTLTPMYRNMVMDMRERVEEFKFKPDYANYSIKEYNEDTVLLEMKRIENIGEPRGLNQFGEPAITIGKPETPDELRSFFTHPNSEINQLVSNILESYKDQDLLDFWDKFIYVIGRIDTLQMLDSDKFKYSKEIALAYTVSINLRKSVPIFFTGDEEAYSRIVRRFQEELGNIVSRYVSYSKSVFNIDRLIISYDDRTKTVYVNGKLYDKFLAEGGTPEAVLGLVYSDPSLNPSKLTLSYIKENQISAIKSWSTLVESCKVSEHHRKLDAYRSSYIVIVIKLLEERITDTIKERFDIDDGDVKKRTSELLNNNPNIDLLNYEDVCIKLLGDVIFCKTNFTLFVNKLFEYNKIVNSDDEKNMAPLYATVDYVIDYILSQVEVKSI